MGIPQLSTCCCGCTLKTGTKIIGWLSLIASICMVIMMASGLTALYYIEAHPEDKSPGTQEIRQHLPALKALSMFLIAVHIIGCGLALLLLLGTYQNKAKLVFIWVIVALTTTLLEQALNLIQMITLFQPGYIGNFLAFLVELYFILVVYSFYREIQNVSTNYA